MTHFRNYLTAALEHARAGVKAGQSKEEIHRLPALKGLEDIAPPTPPHRVVRVPRFGLPNPNPPTRTYPPTKPTRSPIRTQDPPRSPSPLLAPPFQPEPPALAPPPARAPLARPRIRPPPPPSPPPGPSAPDDLAVLESDPTTFYVAMATSGIYKTTNAGTTFTNVFDDEGTGSVGDVAIAPTDANLVWVGTGENNNRQSASWGDGVYKSTDGGRTWKNMGLRQQADRAHHRRSGRLQRRLRRGARRSVGAGGERGVYKTTDGGLTGSACCSSTTTPAPPSW